MNRRILVAFLVVFALIVSACAADSDATTTTAADVSDTTAPTTETTAATTDTTEAPTDSTEPAPEGPYEHLARAEAGEYSGTEVTDRKSVV